MVQIKLSVAFVLAAVAIGPVAALPAAVTQPTTVSQLGAVPTSVSAQRPTVAQPPVAQPGAGVASGGTDNTGNTRIVTGREQFAAPSQAGMPVPGSAPATYTDSAGFVREMLTTATPTNAPTPTSVVGPTTQINGGIPGSVPSGIPGSANANSAFIKDTTTGMATATQSALVPTQSASVAKHHHHHPNGKKPGHVRTVQSNGTSSSSSSSSSTTTQPSKKLGSVRTAHKRTSTGKSGGKSAKGKNLQAQQPNASLASCNAEVAALKAKIEELERLVQERRA